MVVPLDWCDNQSPMSQVLDESLEQGRQAFRRNAWREAFDNLKTADKASPLDPNDLELLGEAAWWCGHLDECIGYHERSFTAHLESGNAARAAYMATILVRHHFGNLNPSVAMGWLGQAERLLADLPEGVEHGYLSQITSLALSDENLEASLGHARTAIDIGMRYGDRTLQAYGLLHQGNALVGMGEVTEGLRSLDEATVAAVSGEITPISAGIIYCMSISVCAGLSDYRRAGEFTEAARRWCDRLSIAGGFPGTCRVHRAEIIRLRGGWAEAEQEARLASSELGSYIPLMASEAFYEIGEIRLRMGDLPAAKDAFVQANELMRDPQPGLSLLRLAEGNTAAAYASIKGSLRDTTLRLPRSKRLPAMVTIAIAAGKIDEAAAAADELNEIAGGYGGDVLQALASSALGEVSLAQGDANSALERLKASIQHWKKIDAPYEVALVRMRMAEAHRLANDQESAEIELSSAKSTFDKLGAPLDSNRALALLGGDVSSSRAVAQVTKTFMFTDIVKSTNLVEAIGDEAWEDLQRWHDSTLRSLFAKHTGQEVKQIGDGFLVAFDRARDSVECAVAIQKKLVEHRRSHGFSPQVRIGVHTADATPKGLDYGGRGVHEAARIGALAEGGEILASLVTLDSTDHNFPHSEPRTMTLKGIAEPIEVVTVDWR